MILHNLLYILQGENYDVRRFLRYAYRNPRWWKLEQRGKLVFTAKVKSLYAICALLITLGFLKAVYLYGWQGIIVIIPLVFLLPFIVIIANFIFLPFDQYAKQRIIKKARTILLNTKVVRIGITGSYGKTTTKEIVSALLGTKYKVVKTPENINTDIGIAQFIISHQHELAQADYFIVEMGAYHRGDIAASCVVVEPHYSLLTGITTAHLDRFGGIENTISAKFELPQHTSKIALLNGDDKIIARNFEKLKQDNFKLIFPDKEVSEILPLENFGGLSFVYDGHRFTTTLLAKHNVTLIALALHFVKKLGLDIHPCIGAIASLPLIPHRLELLRNQDRDITIIDDSYNGNYEGFKSGLEVLGRAKGRKVVLTPGLVELGKKSAEIHHEIGEWYTKSVDLVLLIDTSATRFVKQKLDELGFKNVVVYPTAAAAHADLANVLKAGDTILFQNDWSDIHL